MRERSAYLEGGNLGMVLTVCSLWLAVGLLLFGPGRIAIVEADGEAREKQERLSGWQRLHAAAGAITPDERRSFGERYLALRDLAAPAADEPGLTAWVAAQLRAPSVRDLEVMRQPSGDDEAVRALELRDPSGEGRVKLVPVPLRVRFDARYADVTRILARLEAPASPFQPRSIELRRQYPDVRVELDLELWTREELAS